jgi:hypothetical protein
MLIGSAFAPTIMSWRFEVVMDVVFAVRGGVFHREPERGARPGGAVAAAERQRADVIRTTHAVTCPSAPYDAVSFTS